jgi:SAM-dependent methyltransferase
MGKTLKSKALDFRRFPREFQEFERQERELAVRFVSSADCVLDVGCGNGRIVPYISDLVGYYYGIDTDHDLIEEAFERYKGCNAWFIEGDAKDLLEHFTHGSTVDVAISLFSTMGCVEEPEKAMGEIRKMTERGLLYTVMAKGALPLREKYYMAIGVPYEIDRATETIESEVWGKSRAYSLDDARSLAKRAGWKIKEAGTFVKLLHYVVAEK